MPFKLTPYNISQDEYKNLYAYDIFVMSDVR